MAEIYNNPGNIQIGQGFAGTVGEYASDRQGGGKQPYAEFDSPQMGLRAIFKDLRSKVNTFDGDVAKIISKYAPNNENETQAYIDSVIKQIGSDTITADNMDAAVRAIVRFENTDELEKYYLDDPNLLKEAKELAQYDMPATMTYKKAAETYLPQKEVFTEEEVKVADTSNNFAEQYMRGAEDEIESRYGKGPKDGTFTLPPDQIITPLIRETIEEDVTVQPIRTGNIEMIEKMPYQRSENERMQEAARRSMMQGNTQDRMNEYEFARFDAQEDPRSYAQGASSYALPQMQAAQRMMGGGMGYAQGGTVDQAQGLASLGRGGDSTLVHMQPQEVAGLQQLAQSNGTSLTRNPMTGYPEAFSLGGVLKAAAPIAAGYFTGGAATFAGLGAGSGAIAAGAATGAGLAAATGDDVIMGGITGGMGGMSGGGLEGAVANMPGATVSQAVPQTATSQVGMFSDPAGVSQAITPGTMAGIGNPALTTSGGMGVDPSSGFSNFDLKGVDSTMSQNVTPTSQGNSFERLIEGAKIDAGTPAGDPTISEITLGGKVGTMKTPGTPAVAGTKFQAARTLGSPIASLGIGGLEESDFMVKPDFNDPRDKYDPRSKLDLSRDTGISEAMSRDTGLRLLAKGGAVDQEQKAYDERMGGFLTNITTPPPGTAQFAREMQEYHRKRNTEILGNPRDYTRAERMEAAKSLQGSGDTQYFNDVQNNKIEDGYAKGGYLKGPGDGMSDDIPATINGDEPAALADGEFVVPADVVSHLGNGSSEAGSKQLYAMMDRIRKARTGRESQGKEIKPGKYMPR